MINIQNDRFRRKSNDFLAEVPVEWLTATNVPYPAGTVQFERFSVLVIFTRNL